MAAEAVFKVMGLLFLLFTATTTTTTFSAVRVAAAAATWCVARSDASEEALQTALDYACGAGADCGPIQSSGPCYLPNTLQAHASYAFNSYYQRKGNAPDSCSFAGTSTIARTDPSYGSCVYPSSPSTAGGMAGGGTTAPGTTPVTVEPPPPPGTTTPLDGNGSGLTPGVGPVVPGSPGPNGSHNSSLQTILSPVTFFFLIFWFIFQTM